MRSVYRTFARPAANVPAIALLALATWGCGESRQPAAATPTIEPRIEPYDLRRLSSSRGYAAIAIAPGGAVLAVDSKQRALLFPADDRRPRELFRDPRLRALALFPDGARVLVEESSPTSGEPSRLFVLEPGGARTPLSQGLGRPRFLGWRADRRALFLGGERRESEPGSDTLFEVAAEPLSAQATGAYPPGFRIEAVSGDGRRIALRRELHPEADELYLAERPGGEIRLLLPTGADARFRPAAFSADGRRLLLLTDEGSERLEIEWLDLDSGARRRLGGSACEAVSASLAAQGRLVVAERVCGGARELARFDAATGKPVAPPALPAGTRAVALLGAEGPGDRSVWTVAAARLPRDLLRQSGAEAAPEPLTWGLEPGIDPSLLSSAAIVTAGSGGVAVELWPAPRSRPSGAPRGGLIWMEDDAAPPAWNELEPLFQFLAGRGVVTARFRPRGSAGFGRAYRHAADGRLLSAAIEDLDAVRRTLAARGVPPDRLALAGSGGWAAAVVVALATRGAEAPPFASYAAFGADPDPYARWDALAALGEPAASWWTARLGPPDDPRTAAARLATRRERRSDPATPPPLAPLLESAALPAPDALRRHLAPLFAPR
jgi:hypothetical protein